METHAQLPLQLTKPLPTAEVVELKSESLPAFTAETKEAWLKQFKLKEMELTLASLREELEQLQVVLSP